MYNCTDFLDDNAHGITQCGIWTPRAHLETVKQNWWQRGRSPILIRTNTVPDVIVFGKCWNIKMVLVELHYNSFCHCWLPLSGILSDIILEDIVSLPIPVKHCTSFCEIHIRDSHTVCHVKNSTNVSSSWPSPDCPELYVNVLSCPSHYCPRNH